MCRLVGKVLREVWWKTTEALCEKRRYILYTHDEVIDRWNRAKLHSDPFSSLFFLFFSFLLTLWKIYLKANGTLALPSSGDVLNRDKMQMRLRGAKMKIVD